MWGDRFACVMAVSIALSALVGCAGIQPPTPSDVLKQPLGQGSLRTGMSKDQVISLWGKPDTTRPGVANKERWNGPREMWTYYAKMSALPVDADYLSRTRKLYFDGDNLTDID